MQNPQLCGKEIPRAGKHKSNHRTLNSRHENMASFVSALLRHRQKLNLIDSDTQQTVEELLSSYNDDTLILCGYSTTRIRLNNHVRSIEATIHQISRQGIEVICLRNNP